MQVVHGSELSRWRLHLKFYSKLSVLRVVQLHIEVSVWWNVARYCLYLKESCCRMIRLSSGCSQLRVHMDTELPRNQRILHYVI